MFNRVKGTQDFLDLTLFSFLITKVKEHLTTYNFIEISTPILEPLELFQRSLGLETDVVSKEMYLVEGDEDERICLRPEATASCVRAFVNNNVQHTPWKVFLWGPMFRHERPQKGRFREFHQINMEIIGSNSIYQDVQFLKMLDRLFAEVLKLDTYGLLINFLGCAADRAAYRKKLRLFLDKQTGICATCNVRKEKNIMRVFDCKIEDCQLLYKSAPRIADNLCEACQIEWKQLKENLENLSVSYSYAPMLVRGLDYYDKTVFEFVSSELGAQNAFCGGGRYNSLVKEVGAKQDEPSIGASIGIERILMLLERIKDGKLTLPVQPKLYLIIPLTPEQQTLALLIADELQAHGLCTDILLEGDSIKSMMRKANKMAAHYALLLGPDEQKEKSVTVKNMTTGAEEKVLQRDLVKHLAQ